MKSLNVVGAFFVLHLTSKKVILNLPQYIQSYFGISDTDVSKVVELFEETTLSKGDYYVKAGHYCNQLSFIQEGFIRVWAETPHKEITQWISTPGYFITDLSSLIFKTTARWNLQAITDCKLYTIKQERYNQIHNLVDNWDELEKLFIAKCFLTLEDRVFSQISMTAEERYQQLFETNPSLFNQVPLQYLASMLGMSPETFSRIRAKS